MSLPPPLPELRKQVMAKLLALKQSDPTAGLAQAQALIAKEYGFDSWAALQSARARPAKGWRNPNAPLRGPENLAPERFRLNALLENETDIRTQQKFFRNGMLMQAGFLFAALAGLWLLFAKTQAGGAWHGLLRWAHALMG
jgi:hypothetical protein